MMAKQSIIKHCLRLNMQNEQHQRIQKVLEGLNKDIHKSEKSQRAIWYGIEQCDVLKIADNEIKWLTGMDDYDEGVRVIKERSNVKLVNVTLGNQGSLAYYKDKKIYGKPFLSDKTIDTTGAGDTFCACVLSFLLEHDLSDLMEADLEKMLLFANAAASIVTTRKGAIRSMPERREIHILLDSQ